MSIFLRAASRRTQKLILLTLLVLIISVSVIFAQQVKGTATTITQTVNAQFLLERGIKLYESQQFSQAVTVWQQAAVTFAQKGDNLKEALALSNLSSAYQELGEWEAAQTVIAKSLKLLRTLKNLATSQIYWEIQAKALNTQGSLELAMGKLEEALATWKQTTATYTKADDHVGIIGSLLNQVKALQALGLSRQTENTLVQVNQILNSELDPALKATGLLHFGNALRRVGRLTESSEIFAQSLQIARQSPAKAAILLELGNTERALSNQAVVIAKKEEVTKHAHKAIQFYQQASDLGKQIQPQLNHLSLLVEIGQWSEARELWPKIQQSIANLPPSRIAIYARLNLARSLTCLQFNLQSNVDDTEAIVCINNKTQAQLPAQNIVIGTPSWREIAQIIAIAVQQAQSLQDLRSESYGLGQMGELYELTKQWSDAQALTQQALFIAQKMQAPEIYYRWEWQLGRLLKKQGNSKGAIATYTAAVETLKSVRQDLFTVNPDVQFSFRDQAEPVYRELVDLLLSNQGNTQPSQENLKRAIADIDALQLAELENFLGCNLGQTVSLNQNPDQVSPEAAFIYPIILKDRLEVIFKLPGQSIKHYKYLLQQTAVEKTIEGLRIALLGRNAGKVREISQEIYRWLLEPLEPHLEKSREVKTLVFVLDGNLRNIPMSILYDGKTNEYLIEKKYALALLPNAELFDLQRKTKQLKVLAAGINISLEVENRRFEAINATEELQQIQQTVSSKILINEQFTKATLQKNLNSGAFSALHLATHANFSSNSEETFILAYGELLRANDLENLVTSNKLKTSGAIELLVLSACETAEGDNRATLGLAGLAVRSGVPSTLATLWQVNDESTVKLIKQFYKGLNQLGMSKAQALHQAQQTLLKERKYQNPYYWAPYVLVGNWF